MRSGLVGGHCDDTQRNLEDHRLPGHRSKESTAYGMNMKQFIIACEQEWAFRSKRIDGRGGLGKVSGPVPVHLCVVSVRWE